MSTHLLGELRVVWGHMVARVGTVAFQGIEAVPVDVQVMVAPGKMGMSIYGLIIFMRRLIFRCTPSVTGLLIDD
nr:hypothetical protein [Brucella pituitosa]